MKYAKTPAKLMEAMRHSRTTECAGSSHFFCTGEKCEKPLDLPYLADLKNPLTKEKGHAGHRAELECERSAPNSLLNSVLGETLETFIKATTWNWIVNDLLRSKGIALSWEKTSKTTGSIVQGAPYVGERKDRNNVRKDEE